MPGEIEILARAHALFAGAPGVGRSAELAGPGSAAAAAPAQSGAMSASYQQAAAQRWAQWAASARTDDELVRVLAEQLNGSFRVSSGNGTTLHLDFAPDKEPMRIAS